MNKLKISFLKDVSFEQFKSFLDSLDEERKTWSLDLQSFKDEREFYEKQSYFCILMLDNNKVIAFISGYEVSSHSFEVSFVVKKEYQGNDIGTHMLIEMENKLRKFNKEIKVIYAKHYKDNIASHKAFLKAGYIQRIPPWDKDNEFSWKIKELKPQYRTQDVLDDLKITFFKDVSFEQFKSFLDSLDEERKTWSLDLQSFKDEREFYDERVKYPWQGIICLCGDNIIALSTCFNIRDYKYASEVSFVVKTEFQGKGVGTKMLLETEILQKKAGKKNIIAKLYKDNIASYKAFLKAGYKELKEENNLIWAIKEL